MADINECPNDNEKCLKEECQYYDEEIYTKGKFKLREYEDVNYCEHSFSYGDKELTDREVVDLLNELSENLTGCNKTANNAIDAIKALTDENQTLNNKLNNFKLHSKDLESENQLLKKALRELLENDGNAYMIDLMDKIFDLNYREWYNPIGHNSEDYVDWEEELQKIMKGEKLKNLQNG